METWAGTTGVGTLREETVEDYLAAFGVYQPATGTQIDITIIWTDAKGTVRQQRAQDWVRNVKTGKPLEFPWVFAGSALHITALSLAPLAIVQPIGVLSLVITVSLARRTAAFPRVSCVPRRARRPGPD